MAEATCCRDWRPRKCTRSANFKLLGQRLKTRLLRTVSNDLQRQCRKVRGRVPPRRGQHFVPLDRKQVAHAEHYRSAGERLAAARREQLGIHAVVHDGRPATGPCAGQHLLANALADADDPARRSIYALRNTSAPFPGPPANLLRRKSVETVHRDHIRHSQFLAQ